MSLAGSSQMFVVLVQGVGFGVVPVVEEPAL